MGEAATSQIRDELLIIDVQARGFITRFIFFSIYYFVIVQGVNNITISAIYCDICILQRELNSRNCQTVRLKIKHRLLTHGEMNEK